MFSRRTFVYILFLLAFSLIVSTAIGGEQQGAKALFHSGEGTRFRTEGSSPPPDKKYSAVPKEEKFIGISYQLVKLYPDGQFKVVPKSHVFDNGDRVKFLVRVNRPGYLTILNIGTSGNTNLLFNDFVQPFAITEIPPSGNLHFVGPPGTEKIIMMLSNNPNPFGTPKPSQGPPYLASHNYRSLEGAKDLVLEDKLQTKYGVIMPQNGYRPAKLGTKDLMLESDVATGSHYGVVSASILQAGGILTLETTLRHR